MAIGKNLLSGTLVSAISASNTTDIEIDVGASSLAEATSMLPSVSSSSPMYMTIMPKTGVANELNSEIIKITAISTLSSSGNYYLQITACVRGQRDTTAKAFDEGCLITNGIYADDTAFVSDDGTSETATPWVSASDIVWNTVLNKIYPVGSIFMSTTLTSASDVATALGGGTWVAWGAGRVPVGVDTSDTAFDTVEETGGEKTHTLVENELPNISGSWKIHGQESGTEFYGVNGHATGSLISNQYKAFSSSVSGAHSYYNPGFAFGNDGAHNNLQPYITCYMYKRTA